MITSLVSIPTDTVALEGAWYEPDGSRRTGAALLFHGNTMNFYSGAPRFLPPALVLLSAHCGGKNMVLLASKAGLLAGDRLAEVTAQAERMVKEGRGRELMLLPGWWYVTSAASFLDLANCPDILELAPKIRCPVLYLRGDQEPHDLYPAEEFARRCGAKCTVEIVPQCDHFYLGREAEISRRVTVWLRGTVSWLESLHP